MHTFIRTLEALSSRAAGLLAWLAGFVLVAMMLLACANMVTRALATSIKGTVELVGFAGAVLTAFSLGYTQINRGHIAVGLLARYFPKPVRRGMDALYLGLSCLFFAWAGVETTRWGLSLVQSGELSETLRIIYYPFVFCAALGCLIIALVLLADTLKTLFPAPPATSPTTSVNADGKGN